MFCTNTFDWQFFNNWTGMLYASFVWTHVMQWSLGDKKCWKICPISLIRAWSGILFILSKTTRLYFPRVQILVCTILAATGSVKCRFGTQSRTSCQQSFGLLITDNEPGLARSWLSPYPSTLSYEDQARTSRSSWATAREGRRRTAQGPLHQVSSPARGGIHVVKGAHDSDSRSAMAPRCPPCPQ